MNLIHVPEINRWAKGTWVWNGIRFNTLKEAKSFIDYVQVKPSVFHLITEYEGYDYIAHYDNEGIITSIVEIVPEKTPCPTYHYTKSRRVEFANSGHSLVYKGKR
jgi:hypothetical protein